MIATKKVLPLLALALTSVAAYAADYYVAPAPTGSDDNTGMSSVAPFATIDKAVITATSSADVIHVAAGTYQTGLPDYVAQTDNAKWGPNLNAKLIGEGTTRGDVVLESHGEYRTLRMAVGSWLENVTVVGNTDITKVDKGGAIEMSGGTVTNCVIRDGTAYGNDSKNAGGNLYVNSDGALVVDCEISGGASKNRGGNVCLDHGTLRDCTITGGSVADGSENNGGNVWTYQGKIEDCTISGGSAVLGGNVYVYNSVASVSGGTISDGTATQYGGNVYLQAGTISKATVSGGSTTTTSGNYGGGNVYADGNAVVSECVILGGSAYRRGGNIYALGGATIQDCAITNGTCSANIGGNIYMEAATVTNSTVYGGSAPSGRGGNIFLNNAASLVTDCTIENGTAGTQGGNVYVGAGAVSGSTIANGTAAQSGGNIYLASGSVSDSTISGGTANGTEWTHGGGNVYMPDSAAVTVSRCSISLGTASNGGGIRVRHADSVVEDCLIFSNPSGGICADKGKYYNNTIIANSEYGIWGYGSASKTGTLWINNVIYGNVRNDSNYQWHGDKPDASSEKVINCAFGDETLADAYSDKNCIYLAEDSAFVDYANGDYHPVSGGALVDAGATDPRGAAASATDLEGKPRSSGTIDIGCYEYQKLDMTVHIDSVTLDQPFAPAVVTFTHSADNSAAPETLVYAYDFGDGTTQNDISTGSVVHTYTTPGAYTVKITATNTDAEESAEMTYEGYVKVASATVYVTPGTGSGTFPYNTPETGFGSLKAAVDNSVGGSELVLGPGVYETGNEIVVDKALTVRGTGDSPDAVIIRNTVASQGHRTIQVDNAEAFVSNLTIENGYNNFGANLRLAAGVVSNCVIRGGTAVANSNGAGAGVELAGAGTLTHCVVSNNVVQGTSSDNGMTGGAIYVPYNSKNGRISNCLVAYNRYVTSGETVKVGTAGIRFYGDNNETKVENCTIVANTVEGELVDDSAGIYCTSWSVRFRNNIVLGNSETGKAEYTAVKIDSNCTQANNLTDAAPIDVFRNFPAGDFRLKTGCIAFNAGTTEGLSFLPSVDLDGNPRVMFDAIDIGCYECQRKLGMAIILR